ncbi:hypothetical protein [Streptomyces sp. G-5]|uniref:hypothetical protein n=1 Tax=Streptomyces sp. G-5 TaxID=2977231 RepID=UPI0021D30A92|nr:hypothetical protein [Streptomyces sp. G-5]MCU4750260.1 hypothetical protein [Streptomyces sp. G-5]
MAAAATEGLATIHAFYQQAEAEIRWGRCATAAGQLALAIDYLESAAETYTAAVRNRLSPLQRGQSDCPSGDTAPLLRE